MKYQLLLITCWFFLAGSPTLQGIAANGAEVDAELVTSLAINPE